ncbi:hypothetical protein ACJMK2_001728 [Sinanodonta woodiana]|uniref:C-type lectin domain-containing protein n=1 Tax=Sinanodonta woodiana TaxID=1069815 RepID=A0ABD3XT40_SINWO
MIMSFRVCIGVFVMLLSSPISSFFQGHSIPLAPPIPQPVPVVVGGSHSGFGSTLQVLALVAIILNSAPARPTTTTTTTATTTKPPVAGCPSGYIMYTGRCGPFCYRFETQACASFTNARQVCTREGGDLLNVDTCYFDFFHDIALRTAAGCAMNVWMGFSSATTSVNYITVRGDSLPQNSVLWDFGEPEAHNGGGCVGMIGAFKNRLDDVVCDTNMRYFCQIFI